MQRLVPHDSALPYLSLPDFELGFDEAENRPPSFEKPKKVRKKFFNGFSNGQFGVCNQ